MKLPSGKEINPHLDLLSVGENGQLYHGYDGELDIGLNYKKEDKQFIADYIINRTKEWLNK